MDHRVWTGAGSRGQGAGSRGQWREADGVCAGPHHLHVLPCKALEFLLHPLDAMQQVLVLLIHSLVLLHQRLQLHLCLPRALQLQWVQIQVRGLDGPTGGQATPAELQHCPFRSMTPGGQSSHQVFPGHSSADHRATPCRQQPWPELGHLLSMKGVQSYSLEGLTTISKQTVPKKVGCSSRLSFIQPLGTTLMPLLAI